MIRRKSDCVMDLDSRTLRWKNSQGYEVTRVFFTKQLLLDFYESLDG
jgi:hypothetical protein